VLCVDRIGRRAWSLTMTDARSALLPLLGRRDVYGVFREGWLTEQGDPETRLDAHLHGELVLGPRYGGTDTCTDMAVDVDGPGHKHPNLQPREVVPLVLTQLGRLGFHPPMVLSSKSGAGYHVHVAFDDAVPTIWANEVMASVKRKLRRPELCEVYPNLPGSQGLVLALPLCGILTGGSRWVGPGGSRLVHPASLEPYPDETQADDLAGWPRSTLDQLVRARAMLGAEQPKPEPRRQGAPSSESDLDTLRRHLSSIVWQSRGPPWIDLIFRSGSPS
jgi:hypothetical protein